MRKEANEGALGGNILSGRSTGSSCLVDSAGMDWRVELGNLRLEAVLGLGKIKGSDTVVIAGRDKFVALRWQSVSVSNQLGLYQIHSRRPLSR